MEKIKPLCHQCVFDKLAMEREMDFPCGFGYSCKTFKEWNIQKSTPSVFLGKVVLKIYSKFTGEHPCQL